MGESGQQASTAAAADLGFRNLLNLTKQLNPSDLSP